MEHRLTILAENSVGPGLGLLGEHGFAALLELKEETILFDTGRGLVLNHNAGRLKKDLRRISKIVLSHGHSDHTGGMREFLNGDSGPGIYAHPKIFSKRYWIKGEYKIDVSMPIGEEAILSAGMDFHLSREFTMISEGIYLTGEVPRRTSFETGDTDLFLEEDGHLVPDPVIDDQSLVVETGRGLLVLLGCAHAGMINILKLVNDRFPGKVIHTIIGGTHLGMSGEGQLEETIAALRDFGVARIGLSHCTGLPAACRLRSELEKGIFFANTGYQEPID